MKDNSYEKCEQLIKETNVKSRYIDNYNEHFLKDRYKIKKIMEIGVLYGDSIHLWENYFPNATITAIDIKRSDIKFSDRVTIAMANQANRRHLKRVIKENGKDYDIIIDDGGHWMHQQQISFGFLFKYLKSGGWYVLEDLYSSTYRPYAYDVVEFYEMLRYHDRTYYPREVGKYGTLEDMSNSTRNMFKSWIDTKSLKSKYLTKNEIEYLNENIKNCNIYETEDNGVICFIQKK